MFFFCLNRLASYIAIWASCKNEGSFVLILIKICLSALYSVSILHLNDFFCFSFRLIYSFITYICFKFNVLVSFILCLRFFRQMHKMLNLYDFCCILGCFSTFFFYYESKRIFLLLVWIFSIEYVS